MIDKASFGFWRKRFAAPRRSRRHMPPGKKTVQKPGIFSEAGKKKYAPRTSDYHRVPWVKGSLKYFRDFRDFSRFLRARLGRAAGRGEAREAALPASQRSPIPATRLGARPTPALQPRAPLRVLAAAPHGARRRFAARKDFIPYRAPGLRSTHPGPIIVATPNVPNFPLVTVPQRPETSLSVP